MTEYCTSLDFRPSTMEFSTGHLALYNHIYLSGCSQFKQVELVYCTWPLDSIRNSMALLHHFCFGLQHGRLYNLDLNGIKLSAILPTHALNYCVQK